MKFLFASIVTTCLIMAAAECPNGCSGHGVCSNQYDYCDCNRNWISNDCSQRLAPFGAAWVDSPVGDLDFDGTLEPAGTLSFMVTDGTSTSTFRRWEQHPHALYGLRDHTTYVLADGIPQTGSMSKGVFKDEGHFYAECSNKGVPDRATGTCQCFPGFEGSACQRASCPNSCSGHGVCRSTQEIKNSLGTWDAKMEQQCVCDKRYDGPDCSQRLCPLGADPLEAAIVSEVQTVTLHCGTGNTASGTFTLTYTDEYGEAYTTPALAANTFTGYGSEAARATLISNALTGLPNDVIPSVTVTTAASNDGVVWTVTFSSVPGDVSALAIDGSGVTCSAGSLTASVATTTPGTPAAKECAGRGLCDYETGLCRCFRGYTGDDCASQNALAGSTGEAL